MDERTLQALSRALTHLIFRNGVVESLHTNDAVLDDATIEKLNRDVNNRVYTLLTVWFNGTDDELKSLERTLNFSARFYGSDWDPAIKIKI